MRKSKENLWSFTSKTQCFAMAITPKFHIVLSHCKYAMQPSLDEVQVHIEREPLHIMWVV